jgi:NADH dehydrogenase [ubiquinone] 1 alpha subcomplex assembly factor 7
VTPLGEVLRRRIERDGPITVAEYMAQALGHPQHGYYMRRQPFGASGDFVTAPEVSQMFGEIVGLWCVATWEQMGRPDPFALIELGPGRGTLIADVLHAAHVRPAFLAAARVRLVETSPALTEAQRRALAGRGGSWHQTFAQAAEAGAAEAGATEAGAAEAGADHPILVIANEFFDALPVHQLVRTDAGWRERLVGFDADSGRFRFEQETKETPLSRFLPPGLKETPAGGVFEVSPLGRGPAGEMKETPAGSVFEVSPLGRGPAGEIKETPAGGVFEASPLGRGPAGETKETPAGSVFEVSPLGRGLAGEIGARLAASGGAALIIDYGHGASAIGETLQAVRRHDYWDVLDDPGEADITAHVDFEALARAAQQAGARAHGPLPQGVFLRRLGIEARAAVLRRASPGQARDIAAGLKRLLATDEMGALFKVLALTHPALPPPAGFEAAP